jgi:hypothetical protein
MAIVLGFAAEFFESLNAEGVLGYVPPSTGWVLAGMAGAVVAVVADVAIAKSTWPRQVAAVTAWGIVLLQAWWLVLADRLAFFHSL